MNQTLQTIASRYSCRSYTAEPVKREDLETIARAAVQAPSGMNRQPWEIHVVTNPALLADLEDAAMAAAKALEDQSIYQRLMDRGGRIFYGAPSIFFVASPGGREVDCGIVAQNIALAAEALGLGNVICGMAAFCFMGPRGQEFAQRIGFAEGNQNSIAVLVGHAAATKEPHEPDLAKIHFVE